MANIEATLYSLFSNQSRRCSFIVITKVMIYATHNVTCNGKRECHPKTQYFFEVELSLTPHPYNGLILTVLGMKCNTLVMNVFLFSFGEYWEWWIYRKWFFVTYIGWWAFNRVWPTAVPIGSLLVRVKIIKRKFRARYMMGNPSLKAYLHKCSMWCEESQQKTYTRTAARHYTLFIEMPKRRLSLLQSKSTTSWKTASWV